MTILKKLVHSPWTVPTLMAACIFLLPLGRSVELPMLIMAIGGVMLFLRNPKDTLHDPHVRLFAGLFSCIWLPMVFSLPDAVSFDRSLSTTLVFLRFLFMGVFMLYALRTNGATHKVMIIVVTVLCIWSLDALIQLFAGHDLFGFPNDDPRLRGIFYPKYILGNVLAVLTPLLMEIVRQLGRKNRMAWLFLVPHIIVVLLSGSRTSWMMLFIGSLAYLLILSWQTSTFRKLIYPAAFLIILLGTVSLVSNSPYFKNRLEVTATALKGDFNAVNTASSNRLAIWKTGVGIYIDHWLNGIGPRGFRNAYLTYAQPGDQWLELNPGVAPTHPHQITLEFAIESGIFGLLGFFLLWFWLIKSMWRASIRPNGQYVALLVALGASCFPLLSGHAFYDSFWSSIFFWLLAFMVAHHHIPGFVASVTNKNQT